MSADNKVWWKKKKEETREKIARTLEMEGLYRESQSWDHDDEVPGFVAFPFLSLPYVYLPCCCCY